MADSVALAEPQHMETGKLGRKRDLFRSYEQNKESELAEAREARRYYHDKQWTDTERKKLRARGQQDTVRNRIKRKIDVLVGVEQRRRRDPKAYPRNPQDEQSATTATMGLRFACEKNLWEQVASQAAHCGFTSGIGAAWIGIEADARGVNEVAIRIVPEDRFFYDPRSVQHDFSDARYVGEHIWQDIEDAVAAHPKQEKELRAMVDSHGSSLTTHTVEEDYAHLWGDFERQRVRIVQMYEKKPLAPAMQGFGWYYCKFTGDLELEGAWSPYKDTYGIPEHPYEAWTCYIDERGQRYGVVRTMKSVQDEINHRASKVLWRLSTRQMHTRRNALLDPDETRR
ncbi:MAG: hypothetical protein E6Q97_16840 [Desulfurellales bacterium]|nr:MAG: hypothetical protein E6Q97_16840 [Desulfurellales bacterium]